MKNLNISSLENLPRSECDKVLFELVKHLKHCEFASGREGTAYFVNDKYVVKKYHNEAKWDTLQDIFDVYCEENQEFSRKGYSVPRIYSWLKIPRKHSIFESKYSSSYDYDCDFYILEDRVPGRELYYKHLEDIYGLVKDDMSQKSFNAALLEPSSHLVDYKEIVRKYIRDFIEVNQAVESMSDSELERYVMSIRNMFIEGEYSTPDVFNRNVITDMSHLTIIDNHMSRRSDSYYFLNFDVERFVATRIIVMMKLNESFGKLSTKLDKYGVYDEFASDIEDNKIFCAAALERLYKAMKKVMGVDVHKDYIGEVLQVKLKSMVGKDRAEKVLSVLE